jgi:heat shock protein HtpX
MNTLKTGLLMVALFALLMGLGTLFGGKQGLIIGFGLALATNFFAYWFSDKMALSMSGAQEIDESQAPDLFRMIARLAQSAGLPMPRVYIIPSEQPNAFATGRDPNHSAVAVTQGILQLLSPEELEGVLAHELAHVTHRDILISSIAATIAGAIGFIAQMAQFNAMFGGYRGDNEEGRGGNPLLLLVGAMVAAVAGTIIQLAISRTREFAADRGGAEICGNPLALASALQRIEYAAERMPMNVNPAAAHMYIINPLGGDALQSIAALFRTHPPTEERIARLQAMASEMGHGQARQQWAA